MGRRIRVLFVLVALLVFVGNVVVQSEEDFRDTILNGASGIASLNAYERSAERDIDGDVRKALFGLLNSHGSMDSVSSMIQPGVICKEWPRDGSSDKKLAFERARKDVKNLQISYRKWTGPNGTDLYVLQNSYWSSSPYGRTNTGLYTYLSASNGVRSEDKTSTMALVDVRLGSVVQEEGAYFLGFIPGKGEYPDMLFMYGPEGNGSYYRFYPVSYHREKNLWEIDDLLEGDHIEFSYDEKKAEMRFTGRSNYDDENKREGEKFVHIVDGKFVRGPAPSPTKTKSP